VAQSNIPLEGHAHSFYNLFSNYKNSGEFANFYKVTDCRNLPLTSRRDCESS